MISILGHQSDFLALSLSTRNVKLVHTFEFRHEPPLETETSPAIIISRLLKYCIPNTGAQNLQVDETELMSNIL